MPLIFIFALLSGVLLWLLQRKFRGDRELVRLRQELAVESARLRDAENQQQLLFSANPYPMWVYDCVTLRFVSVNDAAVRTYGFSREEFLGMTVLDIRPPEEKPTLLDYVNHIHLGINDSGLWRHRRKDGSSSICRDQRCSVSNEMAMPMNWCWPTTSPNASLWRRR